MSVDPLDRFLAQAKARPQHPAVVSSHGSVSYGELETLSRRLARAMLERAQAPRVLIHLPQCAEAYAAMFASLLAGGTYAPTNVSAPPTRQQMVLDSFQPSVVVTDENYAATLGLEKLDPRVVNVATLPATELDHTAEPNELAYVMFTSGSTGQPKGVMVPRSALAHYIEWALEAMSIAPSDRWSQHPNIGFDLSVLDIYGALCGGATLYPIDNPRDRLVPGETIRRHGLTIWNSVPSVIDLIQRSGHVTAEHFASLRLITFCGEPLLETHLDAIFSARPDIVVHNTYGPTEATVSFTLVRLRADTYGDFCHHSVALGEPIKGMGFHLVDGGSSAEGEIVISGPQLALGYWQDEEQTSAAFCRMKIDGRTQFVYRTGDWAQRRGSQVYFVRRIDRQVKIHGNRLELGEVDTALRACGAPMACTILFDGELNSFIECSNNFDLAALRQEVAKRLPSYGVPSRIHSLDELPRNDNDKIDAKALHELLAVQGRSASHADQEET